MKDIYVILCLDSNSDVEIIGYKTEEEDGNDTAERFNRAGGDAWYWCEKVVAL